MKYNSVFLALGSNLGKPVEMIKSVLRVISEEIGTIKRQSHIYTSKSWGYNSENLFFNQVIMVETILSPDILLNDVLKIESEFGRTRDNSNYQDRTIDIDILFYNDMVINTEHLIIPHPLIHKRKFVLFPLHEIAPEFIHPVINIPIKDVLLNCNDPLKVELYNDPI